MVLSSVKTEENKKNSIQSLFDAMFSFCISVLLDFHMTLLLFTIDFILFKFSLLLRYMKQNITPLNDLNIVYITANTELKMS